MEARLLLLAAAVLTACCSSALEFKFPQSTNDDDSPVPSADTAMNYGTETLKLLTQCSSCSSIGCCPTIVTHSSVIQPVTGYRGNVAIIVDWGPRYDWGRACTTSDHGFIVAVNWGDGTTTVDNLDNFGPYQKLHQYAGSNRTYGITVYYCSNPSPGWSSQRCCDSMYRTIDVSYDPPFY